MILFNCLSASWALYMCICNLSMCDNCLLFINDDKISVIYKSGHVTILLMSSVLLVAFLNFVLMLSG